MTSLALALLLAVTPAEAYTAASAACAAMPVRSTGTKYYFCDCQSGAEAGCVAGNDANAGTSASAPKRTFSAAASTFSSLAAGGTVAFCKGGVFTATSGASWQNSNCRPGTDLRSATNTSTCDIRDYQAAWGGSARPRINSTATSAILFNFGGSGQRQGARILNLDIRGGGSGPGTTEVGMWGIWLYGWHTDYFICNNAFDGWGIAFNLQSNNNGISDRINFVGNRVLNSTAQGMLGGGMNTVLDANYWLNNGSSNWFDHSIYISSSDSPTAPEGHATNVGLVVSNNEILAGVAPTAASATSGCRNGGPCCQGAVIVVHGRWDGMLFENNIIDGRANDGPGCWGLAPGNGGYNFTAFFRNTIIRRNLIKSTGNQMISVANAPGIIVENNILVASQPTKAIHVPGESATDNGFVGSDITTGVTVRNNTVYYPTGTSDIYNPGIAVGIEGTGHVIANNSVYFQGASGPCFSTGLSAGAYTFVGNNACYGGAWTTTYDPTPHITANPLYTNAPTDFTPQATSPLLNAGSATYGAATDFYGRTRASPPEIGAIELPSLTIIADPPIMIDGQLFIRLHGTRPPGSSIGIFKR